MLLRMIHNKKSGLQKPYLAKIGQGFSREFATSRKSKQWLYYETHVSHGEIVDGRGVNWTKNGFSGGYFIAIMIEGHGLYELSREQAEQVLAEQAAGWEFVTIWAVDDGINAKDLAGNHHPHPEPGTGDCSGCLMRKDDVLKILVLNPDEKPGNNHICPVTGDINEEGHWEKVGFMGMDLAIEFPQLELLNEEK